MLKACFCGQKMKIRLRSVIYKNKVEIENVPIFCCDDCSRSEVYPPVKSNLTGLIGKLGSTPEKIHYHFDELCEIANIIKKLAEHRYAAGSVEKILEERINELLDLLLVAQSLEDETWMDDIRSRLSQITGNTPVVYEFSTKK